MANPLTALTRNTSPLLNDWLYTVPNAGGTQTKEERSDVHGLAGVLPGGRLTLVSGNARPTAETSAAGTVYYTPDESDYVRLYDGTRIREYSFTQRSWPVSIAADETKDLFLYDSSGTLTMEPSAAWSGVATRADALAWQAGLGWVKSGTPTRLWLGTVRSDGTNVVSDTLLKRCVWNRYNQLPRILFTGNVDDAHSYTTVAWREWHGGTNAVRLRFICGDTTAVWLSLGCQMWSSAALAVGVDSTTNPTFPWLVVDDAGNNWRLGIPSLVEVGIGWHELIAIQNGAASAQFNDYLLRAALLG